MIVLYISLNVITNVVVRSNANSTWKIGKISAIRMNRSENGFRADLFGWNPHSNGDFRCSLYC
jgi:hypothetical protein